MNISPHRPQCPAWQSSRGTAEGGRQHPSKHTSYDHPRLVILFFLWFHIQEPAWRTKLKVLTPLRWVRGCDVFAKVQLPQTSTCFEQPLGWPDVAEELKMPTDSFAVSIPSRWILSLQQDGTQQCCSILGVFQGIAGLVLPCTGHFKAFSPNKIANVVFQARGWLLSSGRSQGQVCTLIRSLHIQCEVPCMDEGPIVGMSVPMPHMHSQPTPILTHIFYPDVPLHTHTWESAMKPPHVLHAWEQAGVQRPTTSQPCWQTRLKRRLQQESWK